MPAIIIRRELGAKRCNLLLLSSKANSMALLFVVSHMVTHFLTFRGLLNQRSNVMLVFKNAQILLI